MLQALFEMLFELVTTLTGYLVMFVFSLGSVRPSPRNDALALVIGLTFWATVIGVLCFLKRA